MGKGSVLALTGAAAIGALLAGRGFNPGPQHPRTAAWYASLDKPDYTPPGPVFGIVWPLLDGLMWYSGYRLLRAQPGTAKRVALGAWVASVLGIPSYSWVFFGRHRTDEGLGVTTAMLASSAGLVAAAAKADRPAALAASPLVAWLLFANLLQEEVWRRNK